MKGCSSIRSPRSTLAFPAAPTPLTIPDLVKECLLILLRPGSVPRTYTLGPRDNFLMSVHAYSLQVKRILTIETVMNIFEKQFHVLKLCFHMFNTSFTI